MTHDAPELSGLPRSRVLHGKYGRMFRGLPPFDPPRSSRHSSDDGASAGMAKIAEEIRVDRGDGAGDNPRIPAGYTYLGQLIAHDLTFDPTSIESRRDDPELLRNFRTPRLDLDSVYGRGPQVDPILYQQHGLSKGDDPLVGYLLAEGKARQIGDGKNQGEPDLPRSTTAVVWSADPPFVWLPSFEQVDLSATLGAAMTSKAAKEELHAALKALGWVARKRAPRPKALYQALRVRYLVDASTLIPCESGAWVRLVDRSRILATREGEANVGLHAVPERSIHAIGGRALIADPRNDDNVVVSQLHLALARFHNRVLRRLRDEQPDARGSELFQEARRITRWHYQWIIVHDYLPRIVGEAELARALQNHVSGAGGSPFRWKNAAFLPVEFSAGAFRFGHAMIRDSYDLNDLLRRRGRAPFPIWSTSSSQANDLRGGRPLTPHWTVQWDRFLDAGYPRGFQASRKIDTSLAAPLMDLGPASPPRGLAELDLMRSWRLGLPSGQAVARHLRFDPLPSAAKDRREDPLWLYVLREAEELGGEHLGAVGGTIVAEVILGLIAADASSYLSQHPRWTPREEGISQREEFDVTDLIRCAGLPVNAAEHEALMREV